MNVVRDIMSAPVVTVDRCVRIDKLEALFVSRGVSGAPVTDDDGQVVGFVSKSDVTRFNSAREPFAGLQVHEIAYQRTFTIDASALISEAAQTMLDGHVHHLIVTESDEMVGVVSSLDFVEFFAANRHRFY